jgi:hypothetical protein
MGLYVSLKTGKVSMIGTRKEKELAGFLVTSGNTRR